MCKLPHYRRTNWRIWARNNRRSIKLAALAAVTGILVVIGLSYGFLHVESADYRMRLGQLQHDVASVRSFGSLTRTDFVEGTEELTTRRVR